jgi:hypothetical protein
MYILFFFVYDRYIETTKEIKMFASVITAATILTSAVGMPPIIHNDLAGPNNDWAPLKAEYSNCATTTTSYFDYTICTMSVYDRAIHNTKEA